MKAILAPTDFSKSSVNAIDYAAEIAKLSGAKLILFNVFNVSVISSELAIIASVDELRMHSTSELKKLVENIQVKYGKELSVDYDCRSGFPVEEINLYAEQNKVDLIVMGMEGAGVLDEKIIGSTTTSLIKKAKCPVLVIDKNVRYKTIKKMALACDYTKSNNKSAVNSLKEFNQLFNSQLFVLNVVKELETVPSVDTAVAAIKMEHLLEGVNHSSFYLKNEDVVDGINKFVDEKSIDLVVMIPHMHSVLENVFHESNTKRLAFHTKVPLLALHETER